MSKSRASQMLEGAFEVTINSSKLIQVIESLSDSLDKQKAQLDALNNRITVIESDATQRALNCKRDLLTEAEKLRLEIKKSQATSNEQFQVLRKSEEKIKQQLLKRISDQTASHNLEHQTIKAKGENEIFTLRSDTFSLKQVFESFKQNYRNEKTQQAERQEVRMNQIRQTIRSMAIPINVPVTRPQQSKKAHVVRATMKTSVPLYPIEESKPTAEKANDKRNLISNQSALNYAAILNKMETLQQKLETSRLGVHSASQQKIITAKPLKTRNPVLESALDMQQTVVRILDNIERLTVDKLETLIMDQTKLSEKLLLHEDKMEVYSKKVAKVCSQVNEFKQAPLQRELEVKQADLAEIKRNMKKGLVDLIAEVQKKIDRVTVLEEKAVTDKKVIILQQQVEEKANRDQVRDALYFLQQKIKQIILLIADGKNMEKIGAISRLPLKCLSCDKDVFNEAEEAKKSFKERAQTSSSLFKTRKRAKIVRTNTMES